MFNRIHQLENGDWEECSHNIEACPLLKRYSIDEDNNIDKNAEKMRTIIRYSISYSNCRVVWEERATTKSKGKYNNKGANLNNNEWDAYELLRRLWDNYFLPKNFPISFEERALSAIQRIITKDLADPSYNRRYPFGYVKDFTTYTHREAYGNYMDKLNKIRITPSNNKITFYFIILRQFKKASKTLKVRFTRKAFDGALSLYMYRLTLGAVSEQAVINEFNKQYSKAGFIMSIASPNLERYDVDAKLILPNGKRVAVSIKNYGALGAHTINHYRNDLKKTRPQLYFGYNNVEDKELKFLDKNSNNITEKFLKYLTQE